MQIRNRLIPLLKWTLVFLVMAYGAVYFRTYMLHGGLALSFRSSQSLAREAVDQSMRSQIQKALEKNLPQIPAAERDLLVSLQVERLKKEDQAQYRQAVQNMADSIEKTRRARPRYLLEADPYHYLYQTERLLTTGRIADTQRGGQYLQPLMRAPHGHWEAYSLHPYVGLFCYKVMRVWDPKIMLTEAVAYVPLVLTVIVLLSFVVLSRVLNLPLAAATAGMMVVALSPIFIQRSALGWYDTDPYNYIFPMLILASLFWGLCRPQRHFVWGAVIAAFLTGLYSLFWTGWPFILVLIPGCLLASLAVFALFRRSGSSGVTVSGLKVLGIYGLAVTGFLALFLTPAGLANSIRTGWTVLNDFALAKFDIWPNIFLTVGEANGIGLKKLIFLTGNYVTFALAVLGVLWEGVRAFRGKNPQEILRYLFLVFFSIPILFMSLKTERFSVLFVLPLAIFTGFAVKHLLESLTAFMKKLELPSFSKKILGSRFFSILFVFFVFSPMILISAHVVSTGITPIMDDVWNEALVELRLKTPEDAIIDSWWPPGYFITGVARRAVIADGGTQHFRETYWMARALMAQDEREAAGILRMLNLGGNDALELLVGSGMQVPDAVDLITRIVRVDRQEAFTLLPASMNEDQKNVLLDKTHGRGGMPPSYVLLYNDLIEQNLAVSVIARWDFRKALAVRQKGPSNSKGIFGILGDDAGMSYVSEMMRISGEFLKYTNVSPEAVREGETVIFKNGARVDLKAGEAFLGNPGQGFSGHPASFFYMDAGKLIEKEYTDSGLEVSVLLIEDAGAFYSVIADARLIRSVLFQLYYLQGRGMTLFKPLIEKGTLAGGTRVCVFELDRKKLFEKS